MAYHKCIGGDGGGGTRVLYLGRTNDATLNVAAKYSGYANLTTSNFIVVIDGYSSMTNANVTIADGGNSYVNTTSVTAYPSYSYNATTGVLSINSYQINLNRTAGNQYGSFPNNQNIKCFVKVYLVVGTIETV